MKIAITLLVIAVLAQTYYIERMWKFNKASETFMAYLGDGLDCVVRQNGNDKNDIYMAAQGIRREELTGDDKELFPERGGYDLHIPECKKFFEQKCWVITEENEKRCDK